MKMNTKTFLKILVLYFAVFLTACDNLYPTWEYLVDNPLDTDIVIKVDDKEYTIPAKTTQPIGITQGKHTLTYNGSSVNFVTKINSNKSETIMNPTLSNYLLHAYFYVREDMENKNVDKLYEESCVDYQCNEGIVKLPVEVINTLFIEKVHTPWMFGLDEEPTDQINLSHTRKKNVIHKLFREADYRKTFASELPEGVIFPENSKKLSEQAPYRFPTELLMSDCDAANKYMKELENRWKKILDNPDEIFQEVAMMYFEAGQQGASGSELQKQCGANFNPGRDDKSFKDALDQMHKVLRYLSDGSTFIVGK